MGVVDHRAPVVVSQVWYRVGASYEPDGITGISHALEHMMFKGTEDVGPGEFSKTISALGGTENAFTGRDYTAYFETLAAEHLDKALELEADRMRNLLLDDAEFAKEIEVVKEERRLRTEDKPSGKVYEQFNAVAWRASPYQTPIIGWMNDLEQMSLEDLADWYRRWYAPNNAILVVVGDVVPQTVLALARSKGLDCHTLAFDYGQRHRHELAAGERISHDLEIALDPATHRLETFKYLDLGCGVVTGSGDRPARIRCGLE